MARFQASHAGMDIDEYEDALHPDFRFRFQDFDIENLDLDDEFLGRADDLIIQERIFEGDPVINSQGETVPGISQIVFPVLVPQTIWSESVNPDFLGCQRRLYVLEMDLSRPGASTMIVQGQAEFFVAAADTVLGDGTEMQYWQIKGIVDRTYTSPKGAESPSWGSVKVLYW